MVATQDADFAVASTIEIGTVAVVSYIYEKTKINNKLTISNTAIDITIEGDSRRWAESGERRRERRWRIRWTLHKQPHC